MYLLKVAHRSWGSLKCVFDITWSEKKHKIMKISKKKVKIVILTYAFLRLLQTLRHLIVCYYTRKRFLSSATAFSFTIAFCSFWFLTGAVCERVVLLETGIVWIVLKFIAIAFQVINLDFENDSFLIDSLGLNLTISTSKFWID